MEDKQLDKFLNSLLDEPRYAATDADWNRFAAFKNTEDTKKKKAFPFAWMLNSLLILLAVGGSYAYYRINQNKQTIKPLSTIQAAQPSINNAIYTDVNTQSEQPQTNALQATENNNKTQIINIKNSKQNINSRIQKVAKAKTNQIFVSENNLQIAQPLQTAITRKSIEPKAITEIENKTITENKISAPQHNVLPKQIAKAPTINNPRYVLNSDIQNNIAAAIKSSSISKQVAMPNEKNLSVQSAEKNIYKTKRENIQSQKSTSFTQANTADALAKQSSENKLLDTSAAEAQGVLETKKMMSDDDVQDATWLIFAKANASFNQGLQGNYATHKNWSITPSFAIEVERKINEKININLGLGYGYNNALNTQYQKRISKYYFGRDTANFTIQYTNYHYISLPLSIKYNITKALHATAGLGITYMLEMKSNLYDKTYGLRTAYGYGTGFNRTDAYALAGFGVKISTRFTANAQYQLGFTDITKNEYFLNTINDQQRRVHLGLAYLITSK
jgi:Outer membrane protein beta-barrel domain